MEAPKSPSQPPSPAPAAAGRPLRLDAATLFANRREVLIDHEGECYRLRLTRQNKLILTK